jgi:hypothetical protein
MGQNDIGFGQNWHGALAERRPWRPDKESKECIPFRQSARFNALYVGKIRS